MRSVLTTAAGLFLFVSGQALADDWHEASSDHFVIYAEEDEKEIRKYSDRLERYHSAMGVILPSNEDKPSPSNRVTIYVVRSERIVRKLYGSGKDSRYVILTPVLAKQDVILPIHSDRAECEQRQK